MAVSGIVCNFMVMKYAKMDSTPQNTPRDITDVFWYKKFELGRPEIFSRMLTLSPSALNISKGPFALFFVTHLLYAKFDEELYSELKSVAWSRCDDENLEKRQIF